MGGSYAKPVFSTVKSVKTYFVLTAVSIFTVMPVITPDLIGGIDGAIYI